MPVKKIPVVDDSRTNRQFLVETLTKQSHKCVTAASGSPLPDEIGP